MKQQPHAQESEALMLAHVGHALARDGSVVMRRAAIGGGEAGEGGREAHCWPSKHERNKSNLC